MPQTKLQKRLTAYKKLLREVRELERNPSAFYHDGKLRPADHLLRVKRFDIERLREKIPHSDRWEIETFGQF